MPTRTEDFRALKEELRAEIIHDMLEALGQGRIPVPVVEEGKYKELGQGFVGP